MQDKPDTQMEYVYKCRLCGCQFSPVQTTLNVTEAVTILKLLSTTTTHREVLIRRIDYHHCRGDDAIGLADLIGVREVLK